MLRIDRNAGVGSTTGPKTHTSRFDKESGRWARFRNIATLQKFAAVHASIYNHFNLERHLIRRQIFKLNRSAALADWYELAA